MTTANLSSPMLMDGITGYMCFCRKRRYAPDVLEEAAHIPWETISAHASSPTTSLVKTPGTIRSHRAGVAPGQRVYLGEKALRAPMTHLPRLKPWKKAVRGGVIGYKISDR